ncbi:glycosyltransferase [Winogradskyella aurantiaca]|uniref:glycosyltransferase n=1 Tax=Winogradskyella aurantiaca TaxID=2219558 RepID=UPI000E1D40CF|nr:glycosyltransferase [Winogradskyella aurantiaca]
MKVLLFGEFNRTHWNIREGLKILGHDSILVSTRDGFKKVDVDIELKDPYRNPFLKKIRSAIIRFLNFDISAISIIKQIKSKESLLSGYDVIQFINEAPFDFNRNYQKEIFDLLVKWNSSPYLLSTGLDYPSVKYAFDKDFRYSVLTAYFEGKGSKRDFSPALSYLTPEHKKLHDHIFNKIKGVISNDLDYHLPLQGYKKYLGMIPHAINTDTLAFTEPIIEDKVVIFHGINTFNYYKKGNDIFEEALETIKSKLEDKVEIITTHNLPYKEYVKAFNKCHILMDQVYAYDQGFNALEAMAKGKVVFSGAEKEWLEYYRIEEDTIAINALPDATIIANKLEWLILNPKKIIEISKNAREFVEKHHDYIECAKQYLIKWS